MNICKTKGEALEISDSDDSLKVKKVGKVWVVYQEEEAHRIEHELSVRQ